MTTTSTTTTMSSPAQSRPPVELSRTNAQRVIKWLSLAMPKGQQEQDEVVRLIHAIKKSLGA